MSTTSSQIERAKFAQRIALCMGNHGIVESGTALANGYNVRGESKHITVHAARKWIVGDAIPTQEKILVLAKWFKVSPAWLRFGSVEGGPQPISGLPNINASLHSDIDLLTVNECDMMRGIVKLIFKARTRQA